MTNARYDFERLGSVLGDSTRRRIFLYSLENASGLTATAAAEKFGIHRTVARMHLEKLAQTELLLRRAVRSQRSGRPSILYLARSEYLDPFARSNLNQVLALCLATALLDLGPAALAAVARIGREYGAEVGRGVALSPEVAHDQAAAGIGAITAEIGAMAAHLELALGRLHRSGPLAYDVDAETLEVMTDKCPYSELAQVNPDVVCRFDRSMVDGVVAAVCAAHGLTCARKNEAPPSLLEGGASCTLTYIIGDAR